MIQRARESLSSAGLRKAVPLAVTWTWQVERDPDGLHLNRGFKQQQTVSWQLVQGLMFSPIQARPSCRALITGEYQQTDHTEGSCVAIANSQFTSDGGASDTGCAYTCTAWVLWMGNTITPAQGPAQHRLQDITQTATGRQKHALRDKRLKRTIQDVILVGVVRSRR